MLQNVITNMKKYMKAGTIKSRNGDLFPVRSDSPRCAEDGRQKIAKRGIKTC